MKRIMVVAFAGLVAAIPVTGSASGGDPGKGEKIFRRCVACHAVGDGAKHRVGPVLNGVVGAGIATQEGYRYSGAFMEKKAEGLVWTPENLDQYLEKPSAFIKGTKMSFAGLRKEQQRKDVIAYLSRFERE